VTPANCAGQSPRQLEAGLSPLPLWPGCPGPPCGASAQPPQRPVPPSSRRGGCPETRVCALPLSTHAARGAGLAPAGGHCVAALMALSPGRSNLALRPPRRGNATITVKTNPHPLSPPARLSGGRSSTSMRRRPLAGHPTPVTYTDTQPRGGAGGGAGNHYANPESSQIARQRVKPMGWRRPSSSRYHRVHVLHSTQWPQRKARLSHVPKGKELRGKWAWIFLERN
jgi:hypothetical protein